MSVITYKGFFSLAVVQNHFWHPFNMNVFLIWNGLNGFELYWQWQYTHDIKARKQYTQSLLNSWNIYIFGFREFVN